MFDLAQLSYLLKIDFILVFPAIFKIYAKFGITWNKEIADGINLLVIRDMKDV